MCSWCQQLIVPYYCSEDFEKYIKECSFDNTWFNDDINCSYVLICTLEQVTSINEFFESIDISCDNNRLPIAKQCEKNNYALLYLMSNKKMPMMLQFSMPQVFEPRFDDPYDSLCSKPSGGSCVPCIFTKSDLKIYLPKIPDHGLKIKIKNPSIISWNEICDLIN